MAAATSAAPVWAQARTDAADERAIEDARWEFAEGSAHYQARRWPEALAAFERSQKLVSSPNTELMIARSLRELGRRAEAAQHFEHAHDEAKKRVQRGESKYARTADTAASEGAVVRAQVGVVKIHVANHATAALTVDGKSVPLAGDGTASVLHDAGTASVVVRDQGGAQQKQTVTVLAGGTVQLEFAAEKSAPTPAPPTLVPIRETPPPPSRGGSWAVPAAWGAGGLTVAGVGVFTIFGLSSQSTYDDLAKRCGPDQCGPADRADADDGQRSQTIANVGLGVAIGAAVATAIFVVVALSNDNASSGRAAMIRP